MNALGVLEWKLKLCSFSVYEIDCSCAVPPEIFSNFELRKNRRYYGTFDLQSVP